ncbi:MAG: hypothetical protein OIF56_13005 [Cohaesibacter sp.]|nr:hypothetical protein [Cohaesibacter sp.]
MLELIQFFMSIVGIAIPLGLLLIMAGRVRYRNELDTLVRITSAFGITIAAFWLIGHSLFASPSFAGVIGWNWGGIDTYASNLTDSLNLRTVFLFTIPAILVSATMAERGKWMIGNLLVAFVAAFIFPVIAHWGWQNDHNSEGWLITRGFMDTGGAVVFFAAAGFAALATSLVVGPRMMRFPDQSTRPRGHSPSFSFVGVMILILGLAIMTAGQHSETSQMSHAFLNVVIGATFAGAAALGFLIMWPDRVNAMDLLNASLAGGIALIAFSSQVTPASAALVGMLAGAFAIALRNIFIHLEIDDVGDLIASAIAGGVLGGAIAPIMLPAENGNLLDILLVQWLGIAAIGLWSFLSVWVVAKSLDQIFGLRVEAADEVRGLSFANFAMQSEPDYIISYMSHNALLGSVLQKDSAEELDRFSTELSNKIVTLRNEIRRAVNRIQSTAPDAKAGAAMAARMRMADDTLRVNAEDVLLLLEHILCRENSAPYGPEIRTWAMEAIDVLLGPTMADLTQYIRHMPLQAELDELEAMATGAADSVARCAHQIEMVADFCDANKDGFFTRDRRCDLKALLQEKSKLLLASADIRNCPLQVDIAQSRQMVINGDLKALSRMLTLSAEGAFNRLAKGRNDPVRLELREHMNGDHILFECIDTGSALSARQIRAITDPLGASGLLSQIGLVQILPLILTTRLVEASGGEFTLSSEHGLGTLMQARFRKALQSKYEAA